MISLTSIERKLIDLTHKVEILEKYVQDLQAKVEHPKKSK